MFPLKRGGNRWSVDHLFIDQDAIPTLVEVKRSIDTRIRREVVGQMLDYAANAVAYWPAQDLKSVFEQRCFRDGLDADRQLLEFIGENSDPDEFWSQVHNHLQLGKIRMLFVADMIPPELQRIVEFLNKQMNPAEVLAVEVKQYVGENVKTLVPRILGKTMEAEQLKSTTSRASKPWDQSSFFEALREKAGMEAVYAAERILSWADREVSYCWWGKGTTEGSFVPTLIHKERNHQLFSVRTSGMLEFYFGNYGSKPPFEDENLRKEFFARMKDIAGDSLPNDGYNRYPKIPLRVLHPDDKIEKFLFEFEWFLKQIKNS